MFICKLILHIILLYYIFMYTTYCTQVKDCKLMDSNSSIDLHDIHHIFVYVHNLYYISYVILHILYCVCVCACVCVCVCVCIYI